MWGSCYRGKNKQFNLLLNFLSLSYIVIKIIKLEFKHLGWRTNRSALPKLPDTITLTTKTKKSIVQKRTNIVVRLFHEGCKLYK